MASGIGIKGRYPNQSVYTTFSFEKPIGEWTVKLEGGTLDTGSITVLPIQLSYCPALLLSVHSVHTGKNLSPVLAFRSAGSTVDLNHRRQLVFRLI
jgi:hypothetical protein